MNDTNRNGTDLSPEATATGSMASMDPYGVRAMRYVADHCPNRFATISNPIGFFTDLGEQIRDQVLLTEETIMATPATPGEEFMENLGRWKMARLMAEDQVFSEMLYQPIPPETAEEERDGEPEDWYRDWAESETDLNSILQADDQDL